MVKKAKSGDSENIKVAVRVRPLNSKENEMGYKSCVDLDLAENQVMVRGTAGQPDVWTFDYVFNNTFRQSDIFIQVIRPMIDAIFEGYNSTIFAYGQSGSGKTFTMTGVLGDAEFEGIIPRAFHYIFERIKETTGKTYRVFCSFLELYNGKCRDLLTDYQVSLQIREAVDKTFYVQDLSQPEVKFEEDLTRHMEEGTDRRCVGQTDLNAHSSRSHSVFSVYLECTENSEDGDCKVVTSKLNLVDLAGSERQSKTGAEGDRLKEGCNINLSLTALGSVIDTLVKGKGHVPFRGSPLTMLLKDSLGGGSKTLMFANMGPSEHNISETISTLRFADRAKQIKNKPKVQMDPKDQKIAELTQQVEELKARLRKYEGGAADEGAAEEAANEESLSERLAQLEVELEESKQEANRNVIELKSKLEQLGKEKEEADAQLHKLEEQLQLITNEKALAEQSTHDEKSQHHELQTTIVQFVHDVKSSLKGNEGDDIDTTAVDGTEYNINDVQTLLDRIREKAQKGMGGVDKAEVTAEVEKALEHQQKGYEEQLTRMHHDHKEEVDRLSALNDQAQTALSQSMSRLVKMKEKLEKEKAKRVELEEKLKVQAEEMAARHTNDISNLKTTVRQLEDNLVNQSAANASMRSSIRISQSFRNMPTGEPNSGSDELQELQQRFVTEQQELVEQIEREKKQGSELSPEVQKLQSDLEAVKAKYQIEKAKAAAKIEASQTGAEYAEEEGEDDEEEGDEAEGGSGAAGGNGGAERAPTSPTAAGATGGPHPPRKSKKDKAPLHGSIKPLAVSDAVSREIGQVVGELERLRLEYQRLTENNEELQNRLKENRSGHDKEHTKLMEEKNELEQELEHARQEVMAEVQKTSELNAQLMARFKEIEAARAQHDDTINQKRQVEQQMDALNRQFQDQAELVKDHKEVEQRLKDRHNTELQRLEVKLKEKMTTLENNKKVLNTQKELLEKKKQKELELETKIQKLQETLKQQDAQWRQQLELQAEKMVKLNNQKIDQLTAQHEKHLHKIQHEKDKLKRKNHKTQNAVAKVKERYDQEVVHAHELQEELERLKEMELKRMQGHDDMQAARDEIATMMAKRRTSLNERQRELTRGVDSNKYDNSKYDKYNMEGFENYSGGSGAATLAQPQRNRTPSMISGSQAHSALERKERDVDRRVVEPPRHGEASGQHVMERFGAVSPRLSNGYQTNKRPVPHGLANPVGYEDITPQTHTNADIFNTTLTGKR